MRQFTDGYAAQASGYKEGALTMFWHIQSFCLLCVIFMMISCSCKPTMMMMLFIRLRCIIIECTFRVVCCRTITRYIIIYDYYATYKKGALTWRQKCDSACSLALQRDFDYGMLRIWEGESRHREKKLCICSVSMTKTQLGVRLTCFAAPHKLAHLAT